MIILGVDCGLSGALAFLNVLEAVEQIADMPTLELKRGGSAKRSVDAHALAVLVGGMPIGHAFIEIVGAVPGRRRKPGEPDDGKKGGQGVSSAFAFGKSYGIVIGVLAAYGVPMTFVSPQKWKKALGVPAEKDGARARASQLLPAAAARWPLKKHDGRAEAALIALYGLRQLGSIATGGEAP